MSRIYFFATGTDALLILNRLEVEMGVEYVEKNHLTGRSPQRWWRATDLPSLGHATGDQEILGRPFLIVPLHSKVTIAARSMSDGGIRYDVYQSDNPDSVLLRLGGIWEDGSLISGHLISGSEQGFARKSMSVIRRTIRKSFVKVGAYWVGPEALFLLRNGRRLCNAIQSPSEFDLREASSTQ